MIAVKNVEREVEHDNDERLDQNRKSVAVDICRQQSCFGDS